MHAASPPNLVPQMHAAYQLDLVHSALKGVSHHGKEAAPLCLPRAPLIAFPHTAPRDGLRHPTTSPPRHGSVCPFSTFVSFNEAIPKIWTPDTRGTTACLPASLFAFPTHKCAGGVACSTYAAPDHLSSSQWLGMPVFDIWLMPQGDSKTVDLFRAHGHQRF